MKKTKIFFDTEFSGLHQKTILISIGFGKNNIFTEEFERGTIKRQYDQNMSIRKI